MNLRTSVFVGLLAASSMLFGCSASEERNDEAEQDEEALRLMDSFSEAVADFGAKVAKSPCGWLEKLGEKDKLFHLGFIYGYQADASVEVVPQANVDYVWDLYDQEMVVARHRGHGFLPKNASNFGVHAGVIYGFDQSVLEFQGRFVNASVEVGVPLATDLIGVSVAGFASGAAPTADGKIDLKDIDTKGLFGLVASVSGGFESVKAGSGVTAGFAGLDEDVYESAPDGVRAIYDTLKKADIDVSLVTKDGAACANEREPAGCALAFGRKHSSYFLRARVFAEGLRKHAGKAEVMVGAIASTALAVGAVRDLASGGRSLSAATGRLCPQNKNKTPTPAK